MMKSKKKYNNTGFALIITMWVMFIIVSLVISIAYITRLELKKSRYHINKVKAFYLARGGVEEAISELYKNDYKIPQNFISEQFNISKQRVLEDGYYWVNIEDENAKLNLNTISEDRLNALSAFDQIVGKKEIIDSIFDWLDADSQTRPYGAEEVYYQFLHPGYHCENGIINTIEELKLIKGVNEKNIKILKKYLTVATKTGKININTASLEVIQTLPKLSIDMAQKLLYARDLYEFISEEDIKTFFGEDIYKEIANLVTVKSDTFRISCAAYVGNSYKEIETIVRMDSKSPKIIWWQER